MDERRKKRDRRVLRVEEFTPQACRQVQECVASGVSDFALNSMAAYMDARTLSAPMGLRALR
jgi:hypothetical protein